MRLLHVSLTSQILILHSIQFFQDKRVECEGLARETNSVCMAGIWSETALLGEDCT